MNDTYAILRALRGPLLLIVLGTLFALDHVWSIRFSRTWPVLVIMIGIWKLIEYLVVRPVAPPPFEGGIKS